MSTDAADRSSINNTTTELALPSFFALERHGVSASGGQGSCYHWGWHCWYTCCSDIVGTPRGCLTLDSLGHRLCGKPFAMTKCKGQKWLWHALAMDQILWIRHAMFAIFCHAHGKVYCMILYGFECRMVKQKYVYSILFPPLEFPFARLCRCFELENRWLTDKNW